MAIRFFATQRDDFNPELDAKGFVEVTQIVTSALVGNLLHPVFAADTQRLTADEHTRLVGMYERVCAERTELGEQLRLARQRQQSGPDHGVMVLDEKPVPSNPVARHCTNCGKTGHDRRSCPRKGRKRSK